MSVSESQRRRLYADLEDALGAESAAAMMDLLPPVGWADVVRQGSFDAEMKTLRVEVAALRTELRGEMAELRAEVRGQARRVAAINAVSVVAASISTAGLVLGAIAIAR